jgi:flagellar M-ring protein FliF
MAAATQPLAQAQQFWASRTSNQRLLLGGSAVAVVALLAFLTQLMIKPEYKPLMTGLETADAQALSSELASKKIPYELTPDGKGINVAADQLDAARLLVASSSATHSGRMGFEIFDKVSWGQTEFDEKVNYQRALEGELERTIVTLGGVKSARVHLVMATESVFLDRERAAKASVTLKMNRGDLSREQTQSIQRLVAGAVDGLKPADVSIIDADSNQMLGVQGGAGGSEDGLEREMNERLIATLGPVLGADHLKSSVNVEYDPGTTEISEDKYDPAVSVPLTIQKSNEQSGPGNGVGGVAGTTSNVPQQAANVSAPLGEDSSSLSTTENATYGVNKVSKHSIQPAGRIRRVTAALVVDDLVKRKLQPNGKWTETRAKRTPQELKQIEILASNAIGLDTARGDVISVQNLPFERPDEEDVPPVTVLDRARKGLADYSPVIRYGMLFVLFGLAYLLMIRPMQKRVFAGGAELPLQPALPTVAAAPALEHPDQSQDEVQRALHLKTRLIEQVKTEPAESARIVQAWLRGGAD